MKDKHTRVDDKIAEAWENDAKQLQISETEWLINAGNHYLKCKKSSLFGNMHPIITQFDSHCIQCHKLVPKRSWALYGRGNGIICQECYISRLGDKETFLKTIKLGELKREIKILEKQKAPLVESVLNLRKEQTCREKLQAETQSLIKTDKLISDYLTNLGSKVLANEETEDFKNFQDAIKKHEELLQLAKVALEEEIARKKRKLLPNLQ